jgi:hypothetical protein
MKVLFISILSAVVLASGSVSAQQVTSFDEVQRVTSTVTRCTSNTGRFQETYFGLNRFGGVARISYGPVCQPADQQQVEVLPYAITEILTWSRQPTRSVRACLDGITVFLSPKPGNNQTPLIQRQTGKCRVQAAT